MKDIGRTYRTLLVTLILISGMAISACAQGVKWQSFEKALAVADSTEKLIFVDVWAPWCGWCHKMKNETYPRLPDDLVHRFVFTRLNRDDHQTKHRYKGKKLTSFKLARKLKAQTVPTVVILSGEGNYLYHISGFLDSEKLQSVLLQVQQLTSRQ